MKTFSEFSEEIQELTIGAREKRTASDRVAQRRDYRKNRAKKIQQMRRYRKTAGYKQLQRKSKIMRKRGKTATNRQITVRGGTGAAQRIRDKKKELRK
jgi:hypothetical protein